PDGKQLLAAGNDSTVKILEVASGRSLTSISIKGAEIFSTAFSPDGKKAATADFEGTIRIWDVSSSDNGRADEILVLNSHAQGVGDVKFGPDGKTLVVAADGVVNLWELNVGTSQRTLSLPRQGARSSVDYFNHPHFAGLSGDGKLYFQADKNALKTFDARTGADLRTLSLPPDTIVTRVPVTVDGSRAVFTTLPKRDSLLKNIFQSRSGDHTGDPLDPDPVTPPAGNQAKASRFPGIGSIGFPGRSKSSGSGGKKPDTKEVMRINKEVMKKQDEYSKAIQNGETARAEEIMQELNALLAQMSEAAGQSGEPIPFPAAQSPRQQGGQSTGQQQTA